MRDNGIQIVTIRNRYGDVIQRSRITPDGREYVLSYVDEQYYQDLHDWRDPGDDLPPIRLTIPRNQYILDSELVEDPGDYYTFLEQPPVEKVQRLYSVDEVKRSARVRDIARRVDLDTLNFELIEGRTDAVSSDNANLALSDRWAEAVAEALTNSFGIPPALPQGEHDRAGTAEPSSRNSPHHAACSARRQFQLTKASNARPCLTHKPHRCKSSRTGTFTFLARPIHEPRLVVRAPLSHAGVRRVFHRS